MVPQDHFMVVAAVRPGQEAGLRGLLAQMNSGPGQADPHNALLPFAAFPQLHFARCLLLTADTLGDVAAHGLPVPSLPTYLALLGDCDGPAEALLADFAARAAPGLSRLLSACEGFHPGGDLLHWLLAHNRPVAANYINWRGRSVQQVLEEQRLAAALAAEARRSQGMRPQALRERLIGFANAERAAGRLTLSPLRPLPWPQRVADLLHAVGLPVIGLLLLPVLLVLAPFIAWQLRRLEAADPEIVPRPDAAAVQRLAAIEDHDITNPFSAMGSVKPGLFRLGVVTVGLLALDYACRHIYGRGHLTRVQTIHFARWVFLDGGQRLFFASNYDGSLESYMDDFINKVAWGLNLVFSNGVGYPRTRWLVMGGARNAQAFKHYLRRHQLPTDVWFKAYPGLTAFDLARHTRIREGLERPSMSESEARDWVRLL